MLTVESVDNVAFCSLHIVAIQGRIQNLGKVGGLNLLSIFFLNSDLKQYIFILRFNYSIIVATQVRIQNWEKKRDLMWIWSQTTYFNPFRPEYTIVIFIHYKSRIAVAILDLQWIKMAWIGWQMKKNVLLLLKQFH